jgi:hypothetical protein
MNIEKLIAVGEELRDKKWEVKNVSKKVKGKTTKEYLIQYPFNSIFDWDFEVDKYINRRFGKFSSEHDKLFRIDRKRKYSQFLKRIEFLQGVYPCSFESCFSV